MNTNHCHETKRKPVRNVEDDKPAASKSPIETRREAAFSRMATKESNTAKDPHHILNGLSEAIIGEHESASSSAVLNGVRFPNSEKEWVENFKHELKRVSSEDKTQLRALFTFLGQTVCTISPSGRNFSIGDFGHSGRGDDAYPFIKIVKKCTCSIHVMEGERVGIRGQSLASLAKDVEEHWFQVGRIEGTRWNEVPCQLAEDPLEKEEPKPKAKRKHG